MEKFNMDSFKEMMSSVSIMTKPVFENVPDKLRGFASKTMNVLGATAKLSFDQKNWYETVVKCFGLKSIG